MNNEPVAWWCAKEYADSDMEGGHVEELEFNQPSVHDPEGLIWEKPLYTHPADLTDEEIKLIKEVVGDYVCTLKIEIDQQKQAFKGYEHCSNLSGLNGELKDAEKALAILRKAQEK